MTDYATGKHVTVLKKISGRVTFKVEKELFACNPLKQLELERNCGKGGNQ